MEWIFIGCYFLGLIVFALLYFFEIKDFNRTGSAKFKFYTRIPFELNRFKRDRKDTYIYPIAQVFGSLLMIVPMILFAIMIQQNNGSIIVGYTLLTVLVLAFIAYNILTFVKLSNYSLHMIFTTLFVSLTLLLESFYIFFFSSDSFLYINEGLANGVQIATFCITLILVICEFALMLNPQYRSWFKMVKVDAETFNRPKYCYLAILEWGTLLNLFLSYIPVLLVVFF